MATLFKKKQENVDKKKWWKGNFIADPKIALFRAVVERTISAMKQWQILMNESLFFHLLIVEIN
jgi:hypothetical protein